MVDTFDGVVGTAKSSFETPANDFDCCLMVVMKKKRAGEKMLGPKTTPICVDRPTLPIVDEDDDDDAY